TRRSSHRARRATRPERPRAGASYAPRYPARTPAAGRRAELAATAWVFGRAERWPSDLALRWMVRKGYGQAGAVQRFVAFKKRSSMHAATERTSRSIAGRHGWHAGGGSAIIPVIFRHDCPPNASAIVSAIRSIPPLPHRRPSRLRA